MWPESLGEDFRFSHLEQVRNRDALCAVGEDQGKDRWDGGLMFRGKGPKED